MGEGYDFVHGTHWELCWDGPDIPRDFPMHKHSMLVQNLVSAPRSIISNYQVIRLASKFEDSNFFKASYPICASSILSGGRTHSSPKSRGYSSGLTGSSWSSSLEFAQRSIAKAWVWEATWETSVYPLQCLLNFRNNSDQGRGDPFGALAGAEESHWPAVRAARSWVQ